MDLIQHVLTNFGFDSDAKYIPWGNGHINDTFLVEEKFILQRINTSIFKDPVVLMNNISLVSEFLQKEIYAANGDILREAMGVMPTVDGKSFYVCENGSVYRLYIFITDSLSLDAVESPDDLYACGLGFGVFQKKLKAFDATLLSETIPGFHDTMKRFGTFKASLEKDAVSRAADAKKEIDFALECYPLIKEITDMYSKLPLRVTHNDTKLNNILFDNATRKPICVIDLDTVMPGYAANDFGDAIRFGASTAAEDETDLTKVHFDLTLYKAFAKGFLEGCGDDLTPEEIESLPYGCILMTFECGMRFLTDYLDGDVYFKIHREHHNLDRCRTQFKLVEEMVQSLPLMKQF